MIVVLEVTSNTSTVVSDRYALAAHGRQTVGGRGGGCADMDGRGSYTSGRFGDRIAVIPGKDEEVLKEDEEMLYGILLLL